MSLIETLLMCSKNYLEFKSKAENEKCLEERLKYFQKALFWLENYVAIMNILIAENNIKTDEDLEKIEKAKKALINKLSNYLNKLIEEL